MAADIVLRVEDEDNDLAGLVEFRTIDAGGLHQEEGLEVIACGWHPAMVDCFALRFVGAGRTVVMSVPPICPSWPSSRTVRTFLCMRRCWRPHCRLWWRVSAPRMTS